MKFDLEKTIQILEQTPFVLEKMLSGISDDWTKTNEGPDTWSAYDVVGHLLHGERTDWMARLEIILGNDENNKTFASFDRFAQFQESQGKSLDQLIEEFKEARKENLERLRAHKINSADYSREGIHPVFGKVTLEQLLSTWTVHDLGHIGQIARVMAKQHKDEVGPWVEYLRILKD
jgi:hypothetical protein